MHGALAQLGERLVCNQEVAGSIPAGSTPVTMRRNLAFLAACTLLISACGGTEIDADKAESLIKDNIVGPAPQKVDCPDGVEAKKGATFRCDVIYGSGLPTAVVTVHIEDDDGHIRVGPDDFRRQD